MTRAMTVEVGQCYVKNDAAFLGAWQVVSIVEGKAAVPHVRIVRVDRPEDQKTVSILVLRDRRHYRLHDPKAILQQRMARRSW